MANSFVHWLILLLLPAAQAEVSAPKVETVTLAGKVVELTAAIKPLGVVCDTETLARQVGLQGADGAFTPLLSDDASRAFFLDDRLRNRPVELRVRRFVGFPYVQVVSFQVVHEGKLRTPEYYCEICTISVRYPQICPCCQGPLVLQMKPESR